MKVFQELRDLPENVSSMMSAARQEMSHSLSQVANKENKEIVENKQRKQRNHRKQTKKTKKS